MFPFPDFIGSFQKTKNSFKRQNYHKNMYLKARGNFF